MWIMRSFEDQIENVADKSVAWLPVAPQRRGKPDGAM
jgi:hypothetical protein